ncbi:MAG: hypothetical protein R3C61_02635 [Bacteroidia bacterium]
MKAKKITKWVKEIKALNKRLAKLEQMLESKMDQPKVEVKVAEETPAPLAEVEVVAAEVVAAPKTRARRTTTKSKETVVQPVKRRGRPAGWKKQTVADTPVAETPAVEEQPVKRRGRPAGWKKQTEAEVQVPEVVVVTEQPAKRRGRPPGVKNEGKSVAKEKTSAVASPVKRPRGRKTKVIGN